MPPKSRWFSTLMIIATCTQSLLGIIPFARSDELSDAQHSGALSGSGAGLLAGGTLWTLLATGEGMNEGMNTQNGITLGVGLGQLAVGGLLLGLGISSSPDSNTTNPIQDAYNAGFIEGVGSALLLNGSLLLTQTLFDLVDILDRPNGTGAYDWIAFSFNMLLSIGQLGGGAVAIWAAQTEYNTIRAQHPTNTQAISLPFMSFNF
jgi:hypothetical protein